MYVKQGCPLSQTPFDLCIAEIGEMVEDFAQKEGIEKTSSVGM